MFLSPAFLIKTAVSACNMVITGLFRLCGNTSVSKKDNKGLIKEYINQEDWQNE